ncbi:MAG: hypothetical protein C0617_11770 [Desulfuromonas sp.]|uniref:hypothetical protein n=1 Tax=Desulfuromonas sp. TaxID=892 RepID=UPI000CC6C305|nr:hypothetical protein [Desulfuromonas sp.]PLX83208.1 MAG: hypothetical protein C0617_11770 [Desulfuromonas sp.]
MKTLLNLLLMALMGVGLVAGTASAKDDELLKDFVALEKVYIPALFYTNQGEVAAKPAMMATAKFKKAWTLFADKYEFYRPDYANWGAYFAVIDPAVDEALELVNTKSLLQAHEALEAVRANMGELRGHNGFPKFIADQMTAYHGPMEHIVLSLKASGGKLTPALLAELAETRDAAEKAWSKVEKCPVDTGLWGFSAGEMKKYYGMVDATGQALERFSAALDAALASEKLTPELGKAVMAAGTLKLKMPFVATYIFLGGLELPQK